MECEASRCKTSTPSGLFIVTPSLEEWPTKAKEGHFPHRVRLAMLDTNPVFQCLGEILKILKFQISKRFICSVFILWLILYA